MSWQAIYRSKVTTAADAVQAIQSGHRVFLTGNCSIPKVLLAALVDHAPHVKDVEITHALTMGSTDYVAEGMEDHLRVNTVFIGANVRQAVQEGRADFTPVMLSEFTALFKQGFLPLDVALVHVSPPDEHGFCSFGVESGLTKTPAESSKVIIAEVNQQMPRALGDTFIHVSKLDYAVPVDYDLMEMHMAEGGPSELSQKIASHIAELMATCRAFCAMTKGSLMYSLRCNSMTGLSWIKS